MTTSLCRWIAVCCVFSSLLGAASKSPISGAEAAFNAIRDSPPELYAFLLRMPKGADLHVHVGGAVYPENLISAAVEDKTCINRRTLAIVRQDALGHCSGPDEVDAAEVQHNNSLFNAAIDEYSMRNFVPGKQSGHDHFFATFGLTSPARPPQPGSFVAEVVRRAADQNESYLELMALTTTTDIAVIGTKAGFDGNFQETAAKLKTAGLEEAVAKLRVRLDQIETSTRQLLNCTAQPDSKPCQVTIRFIFQVLRESARQQVFAQTMTAFALASTDPRLVGVNFVQPEDGIVSMGDYSLHMKMVEFAKSLYPNVHVTLHAGELAPDLVPPEGLRFHIREAVEVGHAERIGHGVSVMYETGALDLLREMSKKHVAVEINLTSNDAILGVKGKDHPFPVYRKYGVPVVLSTDDEGVSRTHLTQEYLRAALTYGLSYADLKRIVRNGIEYSFAPGSSYWRDGSYRTPIAPCAAGVTVKSCQSYLEKNGKARLEADLERRFREFETSKF